MPEGAWVRSRQHGPAAVGAAQVEGGVEQLVLAGQADAVALAQEAGVAVDDLRREQPSASQLAGAVEVGEHEVEQLGPLSRPASMPAHSSVAITQGTGSRIQERTLALVVVERCR